MTILVSLLVAVILCVVLLTAFWLFTLTPLARRIEGNEHPRTPRLG
jgi:hypothetical protein